MAEFKYTAKSREGQLVTGTVESASRDAVGQSLRSQGLLPTSIVKKRDKSINFQSFQRIFGSVSLLEKLTFIKNLAVTIKAGLPVSKALTVLARQMPNKYFSEVIGVLAHSVETGKTLSESMAMFPKIFSALTVNMTKVGESSGELDKTLEYLSTQIARDYNLIRRTRGALIYPAVVMFALVVIGYLMFTFVLPKLTSTFNEFDVQLPVLTVIIIAVVDIFAKYSYLVLIFFISLVAAFWLWYRTKPGRSAVHRLHLHLPIVGKIIKKINMARFTIVFSGLLRSGMPIVEALRITGETLSNVHYRAAIIESAEKVKVGVDLVTSLDEHPELFSTMVTQMIQVGEESGTMETVLDEVAKFYETEIDDTVKNLSSIIEPVLVIIIGGLVGILAVGLILPIYNISQSI